jgi:hypothetical protein
VGTGTASGHGCCVEIGNEDIDLSRAVVTATPRDTPGSTVRVIPGGCAGGNGISVATYNPTGGGRATAFHLAVL